MRPPTLALLIGLTLPTYLMEDSCSSATDVDGDGFYPCTPSDPMCDCNDTDPNIYPGADEVYSLADDDCDGVEEWFDTFRNFEAIGPENPTLTSDHEILTLLLGNICRYSEQGVPSPCESVYLENGSDCVLYTITAEADGFITGIGGYSDPVSSIPYSCWVQFIPSTLEVVRSNVLIPPSYQFPRIMTATRGGGYIVAGTLYRAAGASDGLLVKLSPEGVILWDRVYGNRGTTEFYDVVEASDGDLVVMGRNIVSETTDSGVLMRLDPQGVPKWVVDESKLEGLSVDDLIAAQNGDVVVVGSYRPTQQTYTPGAVGVDALGQPVWMWSSSMSASATARNGTTAPNGDFLFTGWCDTDEYANTDTSCCTHRLAPDGTEIWTNRSAAPDSLPRGITSLPDGSFVISGVERDDGSPQYATLMRVDAEGNPPPAYVYGE